MKDDLNRVFDQVKPSRSQKEAMLSRLLEPERKVKPMKKLRKLTVVGIAAALMVISCAAAVVTGFDQRLVDYFGAGPEQVELLAPGAMPVNVTVENNGAVLHVTQVLQDRYSVMVLAELTAPEGTELYMGEPDPSGTNTTKGLGGTGGPSPYFMDENGERMRMGGYSNWRLLEDDDPLDNHVVLMFTILCMPTAGRNDEVIQRASSLWVPANDLAYFDFDQQKLVMVYPGDWSFQVALPQEDIGYVQRVERMVGEVDGADVMLKELYLSPVTLKIAAGWSSVPGADEDMGLLLTEDRIALKTQEGKCVELNVGDSGSVFGSGEFIRVFRLAEVIDPTEFLGGTIVIDGIDVPLDGLVPAE